jgi:hypothetical protein
MGGGTQGGAYSAQPLSPLGDAAYTLRSSARRQQRSASTSPEPFAFGPLRPPHHSQRCVRHGRRSRGDSRLSGHGHVAPRLDARLRVWVLHIDSDRSKSSPRERVLTAPERPSFSSFRASDWTGRHSAVTRGAGATCRCEEARTGRARCSGARRRPPSATWAARRASFASRRPARDYPFIRSLHRHNSHLSVPGFSSSGLYAARQLS